MIPHTGGGVGSLRPNKKYFRFQLLYEIFSGQSVGKIIFLWEKNYWSKSLIKNFRSELFDMGGSRYWKQQYFLLGLRRHFVG